jgi:hypothetical protein
LIFLVEKQPTEQRLAPCLPKEGAGHEGTVRLFCGFSNANVEAFGAELSAEGVELQAATVSHNAVAPAQAWRASTPLNLRQSSRKSRAPNSLAASVSHHQAHVNAPVGLATYDEEICTSSRLDGAPLTNSLLQLHCVCAGSGNCLERF